MTEYALLIDGTFKEIRRYETKPPDLPQKGVTWHEVSRASRPFGTLTQDAVEQWTLINDVWTQTWTMVDVSPEEAAQRQQQAADEAEAAAVKEDTFVRSFVGMTPTQLTAYINANTGNLTQMRALVTKMALMLLVLAKREYR